MTSAFQQIASAKIIAFNSSFLKIPKIDTVAALFLSQACYWTGRGSMADGWFYKTQSEWQSETGINDKRQKSVRLKLVRMEIMEECRFGKNGTMHYRINFDKLQKALDNSGIPKSTNPVSPNRPIRYPQIDQSLYTEITTEITTDNNTGKISKTKNTEPVKSQSTAIADSAKSQSSDLIVSENQKRKSRKSPYAPEFERDWQDYPSSHKRRKRDAWCKYKRLTVAERKALRHMIDAEMLNGGKQQFLPEFSRYITNLEADEVNAAIEAGGKIVIEKTKTSGGDLITGNMTQDEQDEFFAAAFAKQEPAHQILAFDGPTRRW